MVLLPPANDEIPALLDFEKQMKQENVGVDRGHHLILLTVKT